MNRAIIALASVALLLLGGCASRSIGRVRAFRAAAVAGDWGRARSFVAPDARIWFENRVGEGRPWKPGEGRWHAWDQHFRSRSTPLGDYQCVPGEREDMVWLLVHEENDYYRLTERAQVGTLLAWFVGRGGLITGFLVAQVGEPVSRAGEFRAWAREHAPGEHEHLFPGGELDPTGDRPPRMRALLERWRRETAVENGGP